MRNSTLCRRREGPGVKGIAGNEVAVRIVTKLSIATIVGRPTRQVSRRYERATPGELIHLDIKKLGRINGDGWRGVAARGDAKPTAATLATTSSTPPSMTTLGRLAADRSRRTQRHLRRILEARQRVFAATASPSEVLTDNASAYQQFTRRRAPSRLAVRVQRHHNHTIAGLTAIDRVNNVAVNSASPHVRKSRDVRAGRRTGRRFRVVAWLAGTPVPRQAL